jgi:two-component system chemotaxis response regulator CheB
MIKKKIRVLIVDDSALIRGALRAALDADTDVEVVGLAKDGAEGVSMAMMLKPDVITMDLKMPVMSGLEAIEKIMEENPTPIIVVSSSETKVIVNALNVGAMDFVAVSQEIEGVAKDLLEKVKIASHVRPFRRMHVYPVHKALSLEEVSSPKVVAIGVSTGGPQALQIVLSGLSPQLNAGIVIVQHMSVGFLSGLIEWLKPNSHFDIREARAGDVVTAGTVLFAPDHYNLMFDDGRQVILKENPGKKMFHVPNIDEMMKSVAVSFGKDAIGVLMTGMGQDGVEGMAAIKRAGGTTIAQDESSSVIFGMNQVAIERGYVDKVIALDKIAGELFKTCQELSYGNKKEDTGH